MPDHNKQHRPRLDRAKVLAEAISLADAEGLDQCGAGGDEDDVVAAAHDAEPSRA